MILRAANLPFDWISFTFILWNVMVCGLIAIFWHAPRMMNKGMCSF